MTFKGVVMKIIASNMQMSARYQYQRQESETLNINVKQGRALEQRAPIAVKKAPPAEKIEKNVLENVTDQNTQLKILLLKSLYKAATGKELNFIDSNKFAKEMQSIHQTETVSVSAEVVSLEIRNDAQGNSNRNREVTISYRHDLYEAERMGFKMQGQVQTADGKTIDISMELTMAREYAMSQSIEINQGQMREVKDPLVINYGGHAVDLGQRDFVFDIDGDGQTEQLAHINQGSGLLAMDHNGDGVINNGMELFGAKTGDGFSELAAFDEDGNGFIDAGDSAYDRLRIFEQDADGVQHLFSLGEKGIGAIALAHINTPFTITDENNEALGYVRDTGIAITENGGVVSVQQIDLTI